jgi:hypothetical protein
MVDVGIGKVLEMHSIPASAAAMSIRALEGAGRGNGQQQQQEMKEGWNRGDWCRSDACCRPAVAARAGRPVGAVILSIGSLVL